MNRRRSQRRLLGMNTYTNNSNSKNPISRRIAVLSMSALAIANAISAIIQITDEQSSQTTVVGIEHVTLGCLMATLVLLIPVLFHIAGITGKRAGAVIATLGLVPLFALCASSNITGEDASFFAAVAGPTNLLIAAGLITSAVALWKTTNAPRALVVGLPLMWFAALPLSSLGGGLLVAAYWIAFAWLLENGRIEPRRVAARRSGPLAEPIAAPAS
jgi:hypothetical protein